MSTSTHGFTHGFSTHQLFGEPVRHGRLTLLPVAKIAGGEGGDARGSGFGGAAKPLGTFVISDEGVRWHPVVQPAVVVAVAGIGLAALLLLRARHCHRAKRDEN